MSATYSPAHNECSVRKARLAPYHPLDAALFPPSLGTIDVYAAAQRLAYCEAPMHNATVVASVAGSNGTQGVVVASISRSVPQGPGKHVFFGASPLAMSASGRQLLNSAVLWALDLPFESFTLTSTSTTTLPERAAYVIVGVLFPVPCTQAKPHHHACGVLKGCRISLSVCPRSKKS